MITAIAWSTPHHRLRRSLSSRRSLWVDALSNYRQSLRRFFCTQPSPHGSGQRSWTQGWRSQTEGGKLKRTEESLLSSGRFRLSPATGRQVARATPSFINLTFSSTTQPSLVLSWAPRKYRNPLYLHRHKPPAAQAVQPAKPHRQAGDLAQGAGVPAQLIAVHRRQLLGGAAVGLVIHQHPRAVFEEA